ncbi:hypothetical protein NEF87_000572 [Candidatus Lokiarchaeum ossiferum]|uniref:Carboxymuconolactone decarboxylase-like domain-containing protein n=1 Tax=Candidatus Lokiarchaeum ossiferum TaxID=2951803 RepID=A0ABY6HPI9_9ARCH|nr:hypothetical protein NEF87_000572 [Candidatus Lokiarchaeum sp. B-35]
MVLKLFVLEKSMKSLKFIQDPLQKPGCLNPPNILLQKNNSIINKARFSKRYFSFLTFRDYLKSFIAHRKLIFDTMKGNRLSDEFKEKIMLAVTAVNGCVYCNYFHSKVALESGLDPESIRQISCLDFEEVSIDEAPALAFAQHYAESHEHPSSKSLHAIIKFYGVDKAQDILNCCQMITFGNLFGNTISAFESRIKGIAPPNNTFWFEFWVYLFFGIFTKFTNWD